MTGLSADGLLVTLNLSMLLARLKREDAWQKKHQHALTLWEEEGLRVVLIVLRAGSVIPPHQVEEPMTATAILEGHNHKEEHILYPLIDQQLSDEERRDVFARMEQISGGGSMPCCASC